LIKWIERFKVNIFADITYFMQNQVVVVQAVPVQQVVVVQPAQAPHSPADNLAHNANTAINLFGGVLNAGIGYANRKIVEQGGVM
jgi:hypothetical protein